MHLQDRIIKNKRQTERLFPHWTQGCPALLQRVGRSKLSDVI